MGFVPLYCLIGTLLLAVPSESFSMNGQKNSYTRFPKWNACVNASITFEFKTDQADSLLMYTDDKGDNVTNNFFMVVLEGGSVVLTYKIDDKMDGSINIKLGPGMNDNRWHTVKVQRNRLETILTVDKNSDSRISLDEDIHFAHIPENNDVFFGGLPQDHFRTKLRYLALPSVMFKNVLRGEIRNVIYYNCTCKPVRGEMLTSQNVDNRRPEACEARNPCGEALCVSSDRGSQCKVVDNGCGSDHGVSFYYLPMDSIKNNILQNPSGLDSTVTGQPQLIKGAKNNALQINGQTQYLKVSGRRHRKECLGNLELCYEGYTMGMWLKFSNPGRNEGIYLSNGGHDAMSHGIAMTYHNGRIKFIFRSKNGNYWTVSDDNFLADKWYHVTVSWIQNRGLHLYINGNLVNRMNLPQRRVAVRGSVRYNDFIIGRSNDRQGLNNLGQITVDEFRFWPKMLSQKQIQENGPMYRYYLNMNEVAGQELIVDNAETEIVGDVSLVDGKIGKAIALTGRGDYIDVGNLQDTCLGDPVRCLYGFTISFWINPTTLPTKTYYFSSSSTGFNIFSEQYTMYAEVRSDNKVWRDSFYGLEVGKWHYVELTWDPEKGTEMFLDLKRASFQRRSTSERLQPSNERNFFIGRSHGDRRQEMNPSAIIDEVDMYYGKRQTLLDLDLIQRGKPNKYQFGLDNMRGDIIDHPSLLIDTYNKPKIVRGKIGKALKLNGQSQVVDIGEQSDSCLGNLDLCHHGALMALWFKPTNLGNDMHFLSNGHNGISVSNQGNEFIITAATSTRKWQVTTDKLHVHHWNFVEIDWDPEIGLKLYINNKLVADDYKSDRRNDQIPSDLVGRSVADKFYLGRGNVNMERGTYAKGVFDELEYWYGPRGYLEAFGYLNRDKPKSYIIPFESIDGTTVPHSRLTLTTFRNPILVQGRIGNGLSLSGRGQYLDLGEHPEECIGNLALCHNGITVSTWLNFQRLQDNSYIFSTGNNGIRMYIKDNYLNVKVNQNRKEWHVRIPQFDISTWNFVEVSWHPDFGLGLYLNNSLVAKSTHTETTETPLVQTRPHVLLGKANTGDSTEPTQDANMVVDEMEIWYGRREELMAFDYILRDNIRHEIFSMETQKNDIVDHPKFTVTLENGARLIPGKMGNAVSLNGYGQFVDIGVHDDKCLANLEKCKHGLTVSMWLKARRLVDDTYFLSTPSYSLFYRDGRLQGKFNRRGKIWEVFTPNFKPDYWHNVDLSWTPETGLRLYIDGNLEATTKRFREQMQGDQPASNSVKIGRSDRTSRTAAADIDEVQFWYGPRDQVMASGHLGGSVNHRPVLFDRTPRRYGNGTAAIVTPSGTIYLINGPSRAQGDQHASIRVNGKSQYIYVGDDVICTGNLDKCPQGFTLRMAMKPENLLNNMYFLDSFPLSIYYRDGKLFATARTPTKAWTVSTPGIRQNEWQDIEITWHPQAGLTMTLNGADAAHTTFGTPQDEVRDWSSKLYLGRSLSDMVRERYADAVFERLDIWNARKQYLVTHKIIRTEINGGGPRPPILIQPQPPIVQTQPPIVVQPPVVQPRPQPPVIVDPGSINIQGGNGFYVVNGSFGILPTRRTTPRPAQVTTQRTVINPGGGVVQTGSRQYFSGYDVTDFDKYFSNIVRFHGNAYIHYDFDKVGFEQQDILARVQNETFTFQFITSEQNGLIWLDDRQDEDLRMYLAVKNIEHGKECDGYLLFHIDEGNGRVQEIKLTSRKIKELNDWDWHTFRVDRVGRELKFFIDEEYIGTITTVREIQLIGRGDVYLGGTPIDYTDAVITQGYSGGITKILYVKNLPNLLLRVSLMQYITQMHHGSGANSGIDIIVPGQAITPLVTPRPTPRPTRWPYTPRPTPRPTRPETPRQTTVTILSTISFIKSFNLHLNQNSYVDLRSGGTIVFRFRTLESRGVLFLARRKNSSNQLFLAFEIYDGKLYFISDFGARTRRLLVSDVIVNDGTWQNIKLEIQDRKIFISLNGIQRTLDLTTEEVTQAYFNDGIYIGGFPEDFKSWYVWGSSNSKFLGCFSDLQLINTNTNMNGPIRDIPVGDYLSLGCMDMNKQCVSTNPCNNGICYNGVRQYYCDCAGTGWAGTRCNEFAMIGGFQGNDYLTYFYSTRQESHTNDISLRFKSFLRNAFLFQTISSISDDYLRAELDNGRVKVTIKVEGQSPQVFYVGSNLDDNRWHNLFIKRRGSHLELFVDSEQPIIKTIQGENFYLRYDKIYFGGVGDSGVSVENHPNYLGLMQNVYWDRLDLFSELKGRLPDSAFKIVWITNEGQLNKFIYRPITFATREVHSVLDQMHMGLSFRMMFNFKTKDDSGVILYSQGPQGRFVAVELVDGFLNFHFNNGLSKQSVVIRTPDRVNNNQWHMFEVRQFIQGGQQYYRITVDATSRDIQIPGNQNLQLTGNMYIGGLPTTYFKDSAITSSIVSRHGFMGCLASVDLNGFSPNLFNFASDKAAVMSACTDIKACAADYCSNGGICIPGIASSRCMCDLTGYYGPTCQDYPVGVYFNKYIDSKQYGVIKFDLINPQNSREDKLAFGFMTEEKDGIIMRIDSGGANEYIELRLENGYLVAQYNTGNGEQTISFDQRRLNDGNYHVVQFTRTADGGFLVVDNVQKTLAHQVHKSGVSHSVFDEVKYVYIGGRLDAGGNVMNPFTGIIGGAFYKNYRFIDLGESATGANWKGTYYVITNGRPGYILVSIPRPTAPQRVPLPPSTGPYPIPGDLGGGGVVAPGASGGGPGGGTNVGIGNPGSISVGGGSGSVGPSGSGGPITGALTGGGAGPVPLAGGGAAGGARAGAVMGAILGTMAFLASLMWAFWGLKPGVIPMGAGGGGGGGGAPSMSISPPTATNLPVAQALGGGAGGGGAGGAKSLNFFQYPEVTVVNGGGGAGGGGMGGGAGGGSAFSSYYTSNTATAGGAGGAGGGYGIAGGEGYGGGGGGGYGGGGGGGYGMTSGEYSTTTTRTIGGGGGGGGYGTGTLTGGGGSAGYGTGTSNYSASKMYSSNTMGGQSLGGHSAMDAGESTTADYDLASGTGTMMGGGGGGSNTMNKYSTMQSSYQVQNVRTVLINNQGTQQLVTYHSASGAVTPGAAGDEVRVDCCLMNEDGRTVVTGSTLGPPQVWNMQTGELLRIMKGDTVGSTNLHLACNDRLLVGAVHADLEINEFSTRKGVTVKKLQIWDFTTGKPLDMGVEETCSALCVMSDPDKVVFGRSDKFGNASSIVVWDLLGNQPIKEMRYDAPVGNNDYINFLALSQNDRYCVAGFTNSFDNYAEFVVFDMTLTSYNINDASILRLDANPECTAILPHEEACTGLRNGDLVIWKLRSGQADRQLLSSGGHAHSKEVKAVSLSQDNKYLVSCSADNTMKLWDMTTEKPVQTMSGHTDEVWCSAISVDNEIIVSGSKDGTIRLWRTKNGSEICAFNTGVDVFNVTMSQDKGTIVALGDKFGARKLIMLQVVRTKIRRQTTS
ncbi:uncharacterized protein LOC127717737 isoform X2 [Mytilus californianus]|uniref:uncharacterized protein LOC127717737 isoform X2 n=1 Tax=Mytilus californianus TaxID=6549 RepID=UPI00224710AC|nr:uncharacterized protein LOC127717737 isoform X2 [Mytilus californianus]